MSEESDPFARALAINAGLDAASLTAAAHEAWNMAADNSAVLIATDAVGERILGAGVVLGFGEHLVASRHSRLDGRHVVLIAGAQAGPAGVSEAALVARRLGAAAVDAALVGGWAGAISGCNNVRQLAGGLTQASIAPGRAATVHSAA